MNDATLIGYIFGVEERMKARAIEYVLDALHGYLPSRIVIAVPGENNCTEFHLQGKDDGVSLVECRAFLRGFRMGGCY